ncbi:hypothetical protein [Streptomyces sp. OV198]|jgi:arginyl-tRNA synthetase|uniref:hypothetical protein n=1 Tax=Streptomyces sp. OV198 TaxID=1882787 RepID=UPI0011808314|nr:hypothetical protein [Streptomyces sp. OV198]
MLDSGDGTPGGAVAHLRSTRLGCRGTALRSLKYAYARIQPILRKAGKVRPAAHPGLELASAECELARTLHQGMALLGIGTPERV